MLFFFLFKQKTAYEMRISDWSSDVCSSDLPSPKTNRGAAPPRPTTLTLFDCLVTGAGVEGLSGTMAERSREGAERMTSAAKQSEIPEAVWAVGLMSGTSMRSEEHTSELQSLMRISYAAFCMTTKQDT